MAGEEHAGWVRVPAVCIRLLRGTGELCFARKFPDDGGVVTGMVDAMIRSRERDGLAI